MRAETAQPSYHKEDGFNRSLGIKTRHFTARTDRPIAVPLLYNRESNVYLFL